MPGSCFWVLRFSGSRVLGFSGSEGEMKRFTRFAVAVAMVVATGAIGNVALFGQARDLFEQVALATDFVDFLTLPAYDLLRD